MKNLLAVVFTALFLSACANQPIYNVNSHSIPVAAQKMSLAQIQEVIIDAGLGRGWQFTPVAPGKLRATQEQQKFGAEVEINFDQKAYSITRISTRGLREQGESVHPHYNFWVRNLESDIDVRLASAGARAR